MPGSLPTVGGDVVPMLWNTLLTAVVVAPASAWVTHVATGGNKRDRAAERRDGLAEFQAIADELRESNRELKADVQRLETVVKRYEEKIHKLESALTGSGLLPLDWGSNE
jgi:uncharacterized protein YlxW (UPF0749 family)